MGIETIEVNGFGDVDVAAHIQVNLALSWEGWYAERDLKQFRKTDPPSGEHWLVTDRRPNDCELASGPVPGAWQLWRCR